MNQNKKPSRKPDWDATTITIICILITVLNVSLVVFQILWWLLEKSEARKRRELRRHSKEKTFY